jgi:hypothetical protein
VPLIEGSHPTRLRFLPGAERWDNDMLHLLDVLLGDDSKAVDTSVFMVDAHAGEAK